MEVLIPYIFRFIFYSFFGIALEVLFAVHLIEIVLGKKIKRRVPKKYLEGFISIYMIPLHGFGTLLGFELAYSLIRDWYLPFRFIVWAVGFTLAEMIWGFFCDKTLGFFSWDYYSDSSYKIGKSGYSMWTLIPFWGIAGIVLEFYSDLLIYLSPHVVNFINS